MTDAVSEIAETLERLDQRGAPRSEYRVLLHRVQSAQQLIDVAAKSYPSSTVASAIDERGRELGADREVLDGYRALAHIFEGDLGKAAELVRPSFQESHNEILLSAWANLDEEPGEVT